MRKVSFLSLAVLMVVLGSVSFSKADALYIANPTWNVLLENDFEGDPVPVGGDPMFDQYLIDAGWADYNGLTEARRGGTTVNGGANDGQLRMTAGTSNGRMVLNGSSTLPVNIPVGDGIEYYIENYKSYTTDNVTFFRLSDLTGRYEVYMSFRDSDNKFYVTIEDDNDGHTIGGFHYLTNSTNSYSLVLDQTNVSVYIDGAELFSTAHGLPQAALDGGYMLRFQVPAGITTRMDYVAILQTPEPATMGLLAVGGLLAVFRKRR